MSTQIPRIPSALTHAMTGIELRVLRRLFQLEIEDMPIVTGQGTVEQWRQWEMEHDAPIPDDLALMVLTWAGRYRMVRSLLSADQTAFTWADLERVAANVDRSAERGGGLLEARIAEAAWLWHLTRVLEASELPRLASLFASLRRGAGLSVEQAAETVGWVSAKEWASWESDTVKAPDVMWQVLHKLYRMRHQSFADHLQLVGSDVVIALGHGRLQVGATDMQERGSDPICRDEAPIWRIKEMALGDLLADHYGLVRLFRLSHAQWTQLCEEVAGSAQEAKPEPAFAQSPPWSPTLN